MATPDEDFYVVWNRRLLLAAMFCVPMGAAVVEAVWRLPCTAEMKMVWRGDAGRFPFTILCWSRRWMGGSLLAMRVPWLVLLGAVLAAAMVGMRRFRLRTLGGITAAVVVATVVLLARDVKVIRAQRHAVFELCDGLERMLAPGEVLVVEDERLAWLLNWYGSVELRDALTVPDPDSENVWGAKSFGGLGSDEEAVMVGHREWFAEGYRMQGLAEMKADAVSQTTLQELSRMRGVEVGVYFVRRGHGDVSSKP